MPRLWLGLACFVIASCVHTTRSFDGIDYAWLVHAESVHIEVEVEDWSHEVVTRTTTYELQRRGDDFVGQSSLVVGYETPPIVRPLSIPAAQMTGLLERIATVGPSGPTEWLECGTYPHAPSWNIAASHLDARSGAAIELRIRGGESWWHRGDGHGVALDAVELNTLTHSLAQLLGVDLTGSP